MSLIANPVEVSCAANATNVVCPVQFLENDVVVTPATISLLLQPMNGIASVVSGQVLYTPTPGFQGYDSFTYAGTYGSDVSNPSLVSVKVGNPLMPPVRAQRTFRARRQYDKTFTCYVRDDAGPLDMSGHVLTATVYPYMVGRPSPLATSPASQTSVGQVEWTLTKQQMRFLQTFPDLDYQLGYAEDGAHGTLFYFVIDADGMVMYQALLEVVL